MVKSMAARPLVFALANPTPEILPEEAHAARDDIVMATGRTDYPNQVNNVLCFPYIFRGALDAGASTITLEMEIAAVHAISELAQAGAEVSPPDEEGRVRVGGFFRGFTLVVSPQRVVVSLKKQQLQGWQGERLVLQTRISSGRNGRTPAGEFHAGPYRAQMHRSSLYDWAPMPWSVQINRHVFIHGFTSVPHYPASQSSRWPRFAPSMRGRRIRARANRSIPVLQWAARRRWPR